MVIFAAVPRLAENKSRPHMACNWLQSDVFFVFPTK